MPDQKNQFDIAYRFFSDEQSLREALADVPAEGVWGLDTETLWSRGNNNSQVSLVQIAAPAREVFVVDALAVGVEPLRTLLESPYPQMVAHHARFDQGVLAGAGIQAGGLIDTLQMARMSLSLASYSLASVTEHLFGVPLDKTLRTSNWGRRPLTKAQMAYAALDARMVLLVYEELKRRLEAEGRFDEVLRASTLGARVAPGKRTRRVTQALAPPLSPEEKRVVTRLKTWRLERARTQNVPAYMICPDRTLEHLARTRPETLEAMGEIYGLGSSKIEKFGAELLSALKDACS